MSGPPPCPTCGSPQKSSPRGDYCPACYLTVGLEGIELLPEDAVDQIAEKPGDSIGRYELIEQIGEGGFGVVFRALQRKPVRRMLALKVIKPGMDSKEVVARFEAERQALAMMDHPDIAKVHDAGTTKLGRPYFVMELVEGLPLTTFCDEHQLSIGERLKLFADICSGVQHAHQKGIIHRDLKPSNILVRRDENGKNSPKIIDFGVAKAIGIELTEQTFFTLFGRMVGTPEYMSPEQAELNAIDVDTRSDIYSLGVILYELLSGCVPFDRKDLTAKGYDEMRLMIREQEPPTPSSRFASLPPEKRSNIAKVRSTESGRLDRRLSRDLDWIVMMAIEKERSRRYETAQGLAIDVGRFLAREPVNARPPSTTYRVGKFVRRNRGPVIAAGITLLALIVGVITSYMAMVSQRTKSRQILIESSKARRLSGISGWLQDSLTAIEAAGDIEVGEDLRNEALACLAGTDMEPRIEFDRSELPVLDPLAPITFEPNHQFGAIAFGEGEIEIRSRPGNLLKASLRSDLALDDSRLSFGGEDSRYLIIASALEDESLIEVIDWKDNRTVIEPTTISFHAYDKLPGQQGLALGRMDNTLEFLDWSGDPIRPPLTLPSRPTVVSMRPGGTQAAIGVQTSAEDPIDGRLLILDSTTGKLIDDKLGFAPVELGWNPSGRFLAMGDEDGRLSVAEPGVRKPTHRLRGHLDAIQEITWSADGRLLATASRDWDIKLWDGRHGVLLSATKAHAGSFSFSPDGESLGPMIWEDQLFSLEIHHSKVCHRAIGHPGEGGITASAWDVHQSPNGFFSLTLATAGRDGTILWNREGKELGRFDDVTNPSGLAFSLSFFYIAGEEGIVRRKWTPKPDPSGQLTMHFGPAEPFGNLQHCRQLAISPDGKLLAVSSGSGVWLMNTTDGSAKQLQEADPATNLTIDWKGRWLTTVSPNAGEVRAWSLPDGELIKTIEQSGAATIAFSPDLNDPSLHELTNNGPPESEAHEERILLATGDSDSYRFLDPLDDWKEVKELRIENTMADIPGRMVFSPRGTALAISHDRDQLQVLHPNTTPMEVLTKPNFDKQWPVAISRDGILIGTEGRDGRLFIWDLMALRREFDVLDIDWTNMKKFKEVTIPAVQRAVITD